MFDQEIKKSTLFDLAALNDNEHSLPITQTSKLHHQPLNKILSTNETNFTFAQDDGEFKTTNSFSNLLETKGEEFGININHRPNFAQKYLFK